MSSSKTVMIVEDESILAMYVEYRLKKKGFSVLEPVATGEDAIALAQVSKPDVIIMDIRLAGNIDGIEASKEICKCYHCNIIFATGYSDDNIRSKAMSLKPLAYLIKPYQMKELISLVDIA
jgi:DNA-binding NarL/FixJ family response regulator